jgi:hypothetical protein
MSKLLSYATRILVKAWNGFIEFLSPKQVEETINEEPTGEKKTDKYQTAFPEMLHIFNIALSTINIIMSDPTLKAYAVKAALFAWPILVPVAKFVLAIGIAFVLTRRPFLIKIVDLLEDAKESAKGIGELLGSHALRRFWKWLANVLEALFQIVAPATA